MTEWWTYGLSDFLMFSAATWYRLLELHNAHWWPLQGVSVLLSAALLGAVFGGAPWMARTVLVLTALAWLFVAWAFHWLRYAPINWGAGCFAIAFALQGLLLLGLGLAGRPLRLSRMGGAGRLGSLLLLAALLYPGLALAGGRPFSRSEWFALMPDPTVLATLGLLLCLRRDGPPGHRPTGWVLLPVPLLWCAVAAATLWTLQAPEWFLLPLAGTASVLAAGRKA